MNLLFFREMKMKPWRRFLWLGALSGAVVSMAVVFSATGGETEGEGTVTLMISASSQGELIPCG
jgi:hypothetical protein